MTIAMQTILAEGSELNVIWILIVVVVWIINAIAKRATEQRQQREHEAKAAQQSGQAPPDVDQQPEAKPQWVQPVKRPPPPPQAARQRVQYQAAPAPVKLSDQVGTVGLGEDQAKRIQQGNQQRTRRMASRQSPEADTTAINAGLGKLNQQADPNARIIIPGISTGLDLSSAEAMRLAVIYQEILSPPKALRKEQGMWEQ